MNEQNSVGVNNLHPIKGKVSLSINPQGFQGADSVMPHLTEHFT